VDGPEYRTSAERSKDRLTEEGKAVRHFDADLKEMESRLRIAPHEATPVAGTGMRLLELADPVGDYSLALLIRCDERQRVCWLEQLGALPFNPDAVS
jgi:hypothetical protein